MFPKEQVEYARNCDLQSGALEVLKVLQIKRIADSLEDRDTKEVFEIHDQGYKKALCEIAEEFGVGDVIDFTESEDELFSKVSDALEDLIFTYENK